MGFSETYQKAKGLADLVRPLLDLVEELEDAASRETLMRESEQRLRVIQDEMAKRMAERDKAKEEVEKLHKVEAEQTKVKKKTIETQFGKIEKEWREKIAKSQEEEAAWRDKAEKAKLEAETKMAILDKQIADATGTLKTLQSAIDDLKSRLFK